MMDKASSAEKEFPSPNVMNLGNQLNFYMELHDITASELARRSGVPKQTISTWLKGKEPRNIGQVKKVAAILKTTVDHLCYGTGSDDQSKKTTELDALLGDGWLSGLFEIRLRRVRRDEK